MFKPSVVGFFLLAAASCKVQPGVQAPSAVSQGDGDASGGAPAAGEGGAGPVCTASQNHCLADGVVFVSDQPFERGYVTVHAARPQGQPGANGEATYMKVGDGGSVTTKHAWATHPMRDDELAVGALAVALDRTDNGVYDLPRSAEEAAGPWFLARIVSLDALPQGRVLVSGGYQVARDALRAVDRDASPRLVAGGAEDRWFVKPDFWFVGEGELPASGYATVHLALAIQAPSAKTSGEGQFLRLDSGEIVWTKHAWRQRAAAQADLTVGTYAFALDRSDNSVYVPPATREQAYNEPWFVAKVVDVAGAFKGVVTLAGSYVTRIEGARVMAR